MINNTFFEDFSIADRFGTNAIKDTYKRAFNEWKSDYEYLTALVIALNHKIWQWFEKEGENSIKARLYNDLWEECDRYAYNHLKGQELQYFLRETD